MILLLLNNLYRISERTQSYYLSTIVFSLLIPPFLVFMCIEISKQSIFSGERYFLPKKETPYMNNSRHKCGTAQCQCCEDAYVRKRRTAMEKQKSMQSTCEEDKTETGKTYNNSKTHKLNGKSQKPKCDNTLSYVVICSLRCVALFSSVCVCVSMCAIQVNKMDWKWCVCVYVFARLVSFTVFDLAIVFTRLCIL